MSMNTEVQHDPRLIEFLKKNEHENYELHFLEMVAPSLDLGDYVIRVSFPWEYAGATHDDSHCLQTAQFALHQTAVPGRPGFVTDPCHHNQVAALEVTHYRLDALVDNNWDGDAVDFQFEDEGEDIHYLFRAVIDKRRPSVPRRKIRNLLPDMSMGDAMFVRHHHAHPRWWGTKAAGALLAYALRRYRMGATWAVVSPFPSCDGREPSDTPTELNRAISRLSAYYGQFGFRQIPRTDVMVSDLVSSNVVERLKAFTGHVLPGVVHA